MLKKHEQIRIHNLLDKGYSALEITELTKWSLGTIYKYKQLGRDLQGSVPSDDNKIPAQLEPFQELLDQQIKRVKHKPTNIFFKLQEAGYIGSRAVFERYYDFRRQQLQPIKNLKHVETEPGEQAQVDWGHFGEISINGKPEKVYLFAYILSWSRALYLEFVVRQNQKTLQACHMNAFEKLGIPKTIVYDNMKTVVNGREKLSDGTTKVYYNPAFLDFARYYKFEAQACPPYWPRAKGKVEASIKYVRNYFSRVRPSVNTTLEELNSRLTNWTDSQANQRIHATTREKPYTRWVQEKNSLRFPNNLPRYDSSPFQTYYTTQYGLLVRNGVTYNLTSDYSRLKLEVREIQVHGLPFLEVYRSNKLAMTIRIPSKKPSWVSIDPKELVEPQVIKHQRTLKQVRKPKLRSYDIEVEQRDINYYSFGSQLTEEL